jgi:hypothetical protein
MTEHDTRIKNEKDTVEKMIRYYCQKKHANDTICKDCAGLIEYSHQRLDSCQFGEEKPTCRKCQVHCYSPMTRDRIRAVMRYAGPRMMFRAPLNWIRHKLRE